MTYGYDIPRHYQDYTVQRYIKPTHPINGYNVKSNMVKIVSKINNGSYSFIQLVVCLTTGPKPLPKRALHIVRSRASSFK